MHPGSTAGLPSGSPVKESSFLNRETSIDEQGKVEDKVAGRLTESVSPPPMKEGIPIRR